MKKIVLLLTLVSSNFTTFGMELTAPSNQNTETPLSVQSDQYSIEIEDQFAPEQNGMAPNSAEFNGFACCCSTICCFGVLILFKLIGDHIPT